MHPPQYPRPCIHQPCHQVLTSGCSARRDCLEAMHECLSSLLIKFTRNSRVTVEVDTYPMSPEAHQDLQQRLIVRHHYRGLPWLLGRQETDMTLRIVHAQELVVESYVHTLISSTKSSLSFCMGYTHLLTRALPLATALKRVDCG